MLYSKYRLNFITDYQTGFPSGFIILYFHQQYVKDLVVPCIYQHLTLSFSIILGNLVCVYVIVNFLYGFNLYFYNE